MNVDQEETEMSAGNSRIGVEVTEVKFPAYVAPKTLFASAHVVATGVDGRRSRGWVHVAKPGDAIEITGCDEYDDVDPGLLEFAVATEREAIIAAIEARAAELKLAA